MAVVGGSGVPVEWVGGETAYRDFTLYNDGVAQDLTGMTVTLELTTDRGARVQTTGDVSVPSSTVARYTPSAGDLPLAGGAFRARFKVTDAQGRSAFFPSVAQVWIVHPR